MAIFDDICVYFEIEEKKKKKKEMKKKKKKEKKGKHESSVIGIIIDRYSLPIKINGRLFT